MNHDKNTLETGVHVNSYVAIILLVCSLYKINRFINWVRLNCTTLKSSQGGCVEPSVISISERV